MAITQIDLARNNYFIKFLFPSNDTILIITNSAFPLTH